MTYIVSLLDCTSALEPSRKNDIASLLSIWFTGADSERAPGQRLSPSVTWTAGATVSPRILIYFVTDYTNSMLQYMKAFKAPADWQSNNGLTFFNFTTYKKGVVVDHVSASEVYINSRTDAKMLAMNAFHESMHNQLHMGDQMHSDPKVGGGIAISPQPLFVTPNRANFAAFAAAMDKTYKQWDAGKRCAPPKGDFPISNGAERPA